MSSKVEKPIAAGGRYKPAQVVVDFDAERLKAPFSLRCGAVLIDYILLIIIPVSSLLLVRFLFDYDGTRLLNSELINAGWLITFLLAITNFVILPLFSGQSLGKILTGLKVVQTGGGDPTLKNLIVRHFVGYPFIFLTGGLGFLISVFNEKGRALHDYLAGTVVIYGQRKIRNSELKMKN